MAMQLPLVVIWACCTAGRNGSRFRESSSEADFCTAHTLANLQVVMHDDN